MKPEDIKNEQPKEETAENVETNEETGKAEKKGFFNKSGKNKEIANLENKIEELEKQNAEIYQKLQRISADYANFQKRAPKQIADSVAYEKIAIIKSLLPSLDNFEHALNGAKNAESLDTVLEGIQLVFDHMLDALKSHGVERISSLGRQFDPSLHEAMMRRYEEGKPENEILEEFQCGYKVGDQVIRPCKVIVNKFPEEQKQETEEQKSEPEQQQPHPEEQKETENEEKHTEE